MLKKGIGLIFTIFTVFTLSACGSSIHEELQSTNWQVVSTNGESYTADFSEDTVSFDLQIAQLGFSYQINENDDNNQITMTDDNSEPLVFNIEENNNEYSFVAQSEEVKEQYGDLTLTPIEEEQ